MGGWEGSRRQGRYRGLIWMPRGPLGFAALLVGILFVVGLVLALSAVLLALVVAAGLAFGAVQMGSRLLAGARDRFDDGLSTAGRRPGRGRELGRPLEHYLANVEEFDHLTSQAARLDPAQAGSWRSRRRLERLVDRAAALRESAIEVERGVSRERAADAARPSLWELIVAATELQRYLNDLNAFPSTRGRSAQLRELHGLEQRREEVMNRRDGLVKRLQEADWRGDGSRQS